MAYKYPHVIKNSTGEELIFESLEGDKLLVTNSVIPKSGPPMHTHFKQDECLTVVNGKIGYQILGEEPKYAGPGETVLFKRGVPHKFWNAGDDILTCTGWIAPAHNIVFFLSAIFEAQKKSGKGKPEMFDTAYLMTRYSSEFDMAEIPTFVKKIILPIVCFIGKLLGKYKHFEGAPVPIK